MASFMARNNVCIILIKYPDNVAGIINLYLNCDWHNEYIFCHNELVVHT